MGASGSAFVLLFLCLCLTTSASPSSVAALAAVQTDTSNADTKYSRLLFIRGLTQSYLEDYDEAVSYFEKALDYTPGEPAVLAALAEAEAARDNLTSALYYSRQARADAPQHPYYYETVAELLQKDNRSREAIEAYRTLLSRFPNHLPARLTLARLQKELGHSHEALRQYETVVDSAKRPRADAYVEMLNLYRETGDQKGLERTLHALIELRRDEPLYRRLLGQLYAEQKRFDEAIPLFEALLEEDTNNPQLLTRLKMLYEKTGQPNKAAALWDRFTASDAGPSQLVARARSLYERGRPNADRKDNANDRRARQLLQTALEKDPTHAKALDLLGTIHARNGHHEKAAHLLQRALDENPRDVALWERTASSYLQSNAPSRAASVAEEGRLLFPGRYELYRIEAEAHFQMDAYEDAVEGFEGAVHRLDTTATSRRERAAIHAGLGRAHLELRNTSAAHDAFERALELNATAPQALLHYARSLTERGEDLDRALDLAQRAVEHNPSDPRTHGTLGWVLFKRGTVDAARSHFRQAINTGEASARIYEHFGDLHHSLGNDVRAQQYWKEALHRAPERETLRRKIRRSSTG